MGKTGRRARGERPYTLSKEFLSEAARWIAADTVTTRSNLRFIRRLKSRFSPLKFSARVQRVREGGTAFANLLLFRGPRGPRPLLCNTHTDTVPPGPPRLWTATRGRPFRLTRRAGRLHGLGVADVKLNLLCQWEALRRLGPAEFRRPLALAATFGEERGLRGARRLIRAWRGVKPSLTLVGEPSRGRLIHRHRGYLVFRWTLRREAAAGPGGRAPFSRWMITGKSAHSSTPGLGVNAVEKALAGLARLGRKNSGVTVVSLNGGTAHNQVPAAAEAVLIGRFRPAGAGVRGSASFGTAAGKKGAVPWRALREGYLAVRRAFPAPCTTNLGKVESSRDVAVTFDLRFPPRGRPARLIQGVTAALQAACRKFRLPFRLEVVLNDPGLDAPRRGPAARLLESALRATGERPRWREKATCTEAGLYHAWGVPAVVWGPGRSTGNVHCPNESVGEADLARAVDFYEALFRQWCLNENPPRFRRPRGK